jgi:hypothetical protein
MVFGAYQSLFPPRVQRVQGSLPAARQESSGRTFNLRPGSLVALDQGSAHDIEALEESAFLLTIAWPARAATHIGKA